MMFHCPPRSDIPRADLSGRDVLVMGVTVATTAAVLALALGGRDMVRATAAWLRERPALGAATSAASSLPPPSPSGIALAQLTGRWRARQGNDRLIVTARGEVWSDVGAMQGVSLPVRAGANFVFGSGSYFCAYQITFQSSTAADWQLVDRSQDRPCPSGVFTRPIDE